MKLEIASQAEITREIETLDTKVIEAFLNQDSVFIKSMLAPDFKYIETSGEELAGDDFILAFCNGELGFAVHTIKQQTVISYHNLALVSGDHDQIALRDHVRQPFILARFTRIYTRIQSSWKLVLHQSTAIDFGLSPWSL